MLDGWGGLHPFGGVSLNAAYAPYWWGWDIARATVIEPDGSGGWMLDGFGGVHSFGTAPNINATAYDGDPRARAGVYWHGWDIARALVVLDNGQGGYVMDGYGGVHAFGDAPDLSGWAYWHGWDIARGLDIHLDSSGVPDGGWTLDGYGGIHPFGNAPALSSQHYYHGWDVFRQLHVVAGGAYGIARWGIVEKIGAPAGINWGGLTTWGGWDIARDIFPVNPGIAWTNAPVDRGALGAAMDQLHNVDRANNGLYPLADNSTLDSIAGNGFQYNTSNCGGPNSILGDRAQDMYLRNLFTHQIIGCSGTQYIFSTYLRASGLPWSTAGENIAWLTGFSDPLDDAWQINTNWLNSPEHYANMMNNRYHSIGCGTYYAPNGAYQGAAGPTWVWACEFTG